MIKSTENMVILIHGNTVHKFSIIYPSVLLLTTKYSVFMVDLALKLKQSIKLELLIEKFKFHIKDHFVILCGQILKILKIGLLMLEVQVGYLDLKLLMIFVILMVFLLLQEHINWFNKVINFGLK
jgi:hypothetical protein